VCWKSCSSCWSLHLLREEFLSAPIHSPLSGSPYRSFRVVQAAPPSRRSTSYSGRCPPAPPCVLNGTASTPTPATNRAVGIPTPFPMPSPTSARRPSPEFRRPRWRPPPRDPIASPTFLLGALLRSKDLFVRNQKLIGASV
jgi:hypothetical protein